jgi:hypothetical protein
MAPDGVDKRGEPLLHWRLMCLGHTAIPGTIGMGMRKHVDVGGVCMVAS